METVNFVAKIKMGDELTSEKWWMKKKEQRLRDIACNIYRYIKVSGNALPISTTYFLHFFLSNYISTKILWNALCKALNYIIRHDCERGPEIRFSRSNLQAY